MESCKMEASLVALTDAAFDKDPGVRSQIKQSLHGLGCHSPDLVLRTCLEFLLKHKPLAQGHRMSIVGSMEAIVRDTVRQLGPPLVQDLIALASDEMTRPGEGAELEQLREEASRLLVALGGSFGHEVLEEMLKRLQPGQLPQFHVVQTLGNLSAVNVDGVVPRLPGLLQTLAPMLGLARQDHMKMVFSSALGLFAQSILEYLELSESSPDPALKRSAFSQEIYACYRTLFAGWLRNKDHKLRSTIVVSLSYMVHLLPDEKLEEELPKLISWTLSLYKKRCEPFLVTQCVRHVLETGVGVTSQAMESQVDNLLPPLHHQICSAPEPGNELTSRNHSEVLRCFTVLAQVSMDGLVKFLLQKLSNNNERVRVGTLVSLDHLVGSGFKQLESKKPLMVASMKQALLDNDNKVKKMIARVIHTMGVQGYLELEGGSSLVEFLVNQCALYNDRWLTKVHHSEANEVTDEDLSRMCEGILLSLTSLTKMEDVLWPFLLEFVTPLQYTNALTVVCTCLERVGARRLELGPEKMMLNYNERLGLPKPHALLARLLAVSSSPFQGKGRGVPALKLLRIVSLNIHPSIVRLWNEELPGLVQYLMDNTEETLPQKLWEDKLFLVLSRTLEIITDEKWTWQLSEESIRHLCNYYSYPKEKAFLYKCVGIVLGQTHNKEVIYNELQEMLLSVQHNEPLEREGLATGIGFCAMTHLEDTLVKLDDFVRMDIVKKTASFFNILKEKLDGDTEKVKSTLILCYGYVALYAPESAVLARVEGDILEHILNLSNTRVLGIKIESKDLMIKLTLIKAVTLVAKAIYANRAKGDFTFGKKDELLSYMQDLILSEPKGYLKSRVRQSSINACVHLVKLEPLLDQARASELVRSCLESVFSLLPLADAEKRKESKKLKEREALHHETAGALQDLLRELLLQNLSSEGLGFIFEALEDWITSSKDHERQRAAETVDKLLTFYRERFKATRATTFHNLGRLIGRLVPRCADPLLGVRQLTVDSLRTVLYIQLRYEGCILNQRDDTLEHLRGIRGQLENPDSQILFQICYDVAKVVSAKLPQDQLGPLLFALFEGLSDPHATCASAASVVMNTLIRRHRAGLADQVQEILQRLRVRMPSIPLEQVRFSVVHFISILTSQCMASVLSCLLLSPLPYDLYANDIWRSLGREVTLASGTMEHLIAKLNDLMGHREAKASPPGSREALAIVLALQAMFSNPDSEEAVGCLYPQLFSSLMLNLSFAVYERTGPEAQGKGSPKKKRGSGSQGQGQGQGQAPASVDACKCSSEALKLMLSRGKSERVVGSVEEEGGWEAMGSLERHQQGVAVLAKAMGKHGAGHLGNIVQILEPVLLSVHETQRMTVATFFGELLNSSVAVDLQLTDPLISSLLKSLHDRSPNVHWLCLRGLGNVAQGAPQKVQKYSDRLLGAMIGGLTDRTERQELTVLEAMSGLSKVLLRLEERDVRASLERVVAAVQSFFESESDRVRAGAITVFGNLSRLAEGESRAVLTEQVHASMVSLLLHLNDASPEVSGACRSTLHLVGPLLCSDNVCAVFQAELLEQAGQHYWEFIHELSKLIATEFPDKLGLYLANSTSFFKSMLPEVRGNAVVLAGFLLQSLPELYVQPDADENVCVAIIMMLHDVSPSVRIKAAKVLGLHRGF